MSTVRLEDVFKRSGLPTVTFVPPAEYDHLKVALRTQGRGVVIEGPSGIGKTTAVRKAAAEIGLTNAQMFSGRNPKDVELISLIPETEAAGLVIIDDFHRLEKSLKHAIAEYLKVLADSEDPRTKIVLIGINKAGDSLVHFASDLNNRIDTIHFEINDVKRVRDLIRKGEEALNLQIDQADELAVDASGSFHMAQILCHEMCLYSGITERPQAATRLEASIDSVRERVLMELSRTFHARCVQFARGRRFRREGRAPYLHLLLHLIRSDAWALSVEQVLAGNPEIRGSLGQVIDKGHLSVFLQEHDDLRDLFHFDSYTKVLAVEDPKVMYFLRHMLWSKFVKEVGFISVDFRSKYAFALSFAGENRTVAAAITERLKDHQLEVFYDHDEQHRILAQDVEAYLAPIYRSEARFVVVLLSKEYPKKIWAKFESDAFRERFGSDAVIPIWFKDAPPGMFDESRRLGGMTYDPAAELEPQIDAICDILVLKVELERGAEQEATNLRNGAVPLADVE